MGAGALALCAGVALGSASAPAAGSRTPAPRAQAAPADALEALREAARKELQSPGSATAVEPPPGVDPAAVKPIDGGSPEGPKARRTLDDVAASMKDAPGLEAKVPENPPAPGIAAQALRLYAQAREKLAGGDTASAITDLEQSTRLDPGSVQGWRELGDAQVAAGRRLAALSSYQQAAQRGIGDARVWWIIGRDALRSRKTDQGIALLVRARSLVADASDPALEYLLAADLGEGLLQSGYVRAGVASLAEGLSLPTPLPWNTRLRTEVIDLLRRRAELRRDAGDACVRLGDTSAALEFYEQAVEDDQSLSAELLLRRVHALRSAGRIAGTASLVIDEMAGQAAPVGDVQISLLRGLASDARVAPLLRPAIEQVSSQSAVPGPTARRQWVRAAAAAAPVDQARAQLRAELVLNPESEELFDDLMATYARGDASARVREMTGLIERAPRCLWLVDHLMSSTADADGELAVLQTDSSGAAGPLKVLWLLRMGRVTDAVAASEPAPGGALRAYAAAARIEALAGAGRYAEAEPALEIVRRGVPGSDRFLLAQALTEFQRFEEALEALPAPTAVDAELLSAHQERLAAGIAVRAGRPEIAEAHILRLLRGDPFDDRAYEVLAALYAPSSPIADENKLAQTIRALRQAFPSSRVLRWVTAQELGLRKMDAQAEATLTGLVREGVINDSIVGLLAATLERRIAVEPGAGQRAEGLFRDLITHQPETSALWAGLARVMASAGHGEQADRELAAQLQRRPWADLAAFREQFTSDSLKKPDAARELTLARLSATPRTIDATVAYAVLIGRDGKLDEAAKILAAGLPPRIRFTPDQQNRLAGLIAAQLDAGDRPGAGPTLKKKQNAAAIIALFEALAGRGSRLAPQMHQARITILAGTTPPDLAALMRAAEQAAKDFPDLAPASYLLAAQELYTQESLRPQAIPFVRLAVKTSKEPSDELLTRYVGLIAQYGSEEDLADIESAVGGVAQEKKVVRRLKKDDEPIPASDDLLRAEFFYRVSGLCSLAGRDDLSEKLLKRALELDPGHGLANNDLGYKYLDDNREPEAAARMLERAFKALPESGSVADSFGWLRYQQGRIADEHDPATGEVVPGAASLMRIAAGNKGGIDNPTIQDHLGDALWRADQRPDALDAWRRAESLLSKDLSQVPDPADLNASQRALIEKERARLEKIRAKITAGTSGNQPQTAPMRWSEGSPK